MAMIGRAAQFAAKAHAEQKRKYSDEPYIVHPFRVAGWTAAILPDDEDAICAAYLHDVVEDCGITCDELREIFGSRVTRLVYELTNPSEGLDLKRVERKSMDRLHIKNASPVAKLIKAIDRWDNLKDVKTSDPEARRFMRQCYLQESFEMYQVLIEEPLVWENQSAINLISVIDSLAKELKCKLV